MKILAIRIKNLASLEGNTEIDFTREPLCSAGIFAITGPTGSGKSTILDALCLALYAKTPRYIQARESGIEIQDTAGNTVSQGDVRSILRDGEGDGFAAVDFVGVDGRRYSAKWNVWRAKNNAAGNLQPFTMALKNISTNTDIPGKRTELLAEIERLIGLNFEQFTRSVLLAQGDFTAFLKAGKDEKSSLLEKLTGTHIYSEISIKIYEKYREEEQELWGLNVQREGIPTLTSAALDELAGQKAIFETALQSQEKQVEEINRELAWHERLTTLQSNLSAAGMAKEQAVETKKNAGDRERKLKEADQVQPTRTWVDALRLAKRQLEDRTTALEQLEAQLLILQQQNEQEKELLQQAETGLEAKTKALEEAAPLLAEARALDIQIKGKAEQVEQAAVEVNAAKENYQQYLLQLQTREQEATQLLSGIEALSVWKKDHLARQPVADNRDLIISKLSDARAVLDTLQSISTRIQTIQEAVESREQEKEKLNRQSAVIQATLLAAQQTHAAKLSELSAVPVTALEKDKLKEDSIVEEIIAAEAHWKLLYNALKDYEAGTRALEDNKKEFGKKEEQSAKTLKQLEAAEIQRATSLRLLERARLGAAENVESLRSKLVPGEPCPVCGSAEHPYAIHNPQLGHVLAELETAHQQNEAEYARCFAAYSGLQETGKQLRKIIGGQEMEQASTKTALQGLKADWTKFAVSRDGASLPDEQKAGWLQQQLQEKKTLQRSLQQQIQSYYAGKQQLENQKNHIEQSDKQLTEINNSIKDVEWNRQLLQDQLNQQIIEQGKANTGLAAAAQTLSSYFSAEDWFLHWKTDPEPFVQRISDFAGQWKLKTGELEENSRQYGILSATIKGMQEQLQSISGEAGKKERTLSGLKDQWKELAEKRKIIFGGEAVSKIEADLKLAIDTARKIADRHKTGKETLQTGITRIVTQKEQAEKDRTSLRQQAADFTARIQQWLSLYNAQYARALKESELVQLLSLSPDWIEMERIALRAVDDAVTQAASVLNERKALLEKHEQDQLSGRQADELKRLLSEAKTALQKTSEAGNEISFRLRQDEANKEKAGGLLKTIEAKALVVENWGKLNDTIGSADGRKFRQIAQEYTLDVLLSHANIHLEMLTKRYQVQRIPGTLGLQVVDQDMGDEVRTVYSLSGGESFLVSLALALGLASLSSTRMQVESLFIDEGFGSLDPATLNIAMDALERLHNQGRKVGVISHVQEMTERIPVQIRVSKRASGKSKVEVLAS